MTASREVRRIVVVDPIGNAGGGSRFIGRLLPALRDIRETLTVHFAGNASSMTRDGARAMMASAGVEVTELKWGLDRPRSAYSFPTRLRFKVRRVIGRESRDVALAIQGRSRAEIQRLIHDADVVFYPWPYRVDPPESDHPMVATIHDLNYRYFFGAPIFSTEESAHLDEQIAEWARRSKAVVSSRFTASELRRFYPAAPEPAIVPLAAFARDPADGPSVGRAQRLGRYVLCGTHLTVHKNIGPLIAAQAIVHARFPDVRLVLTGAGTEAATGAASFAGSVRGVVAPDVVGLGYVSNEDMDALIANAAVVVNPSLYEAGNGPGLDAWALGTPVAMSDIQPFREHVDTLGVAAALFNPRDPHDIAAKLIDILEHGDAWRPGVARSRTAVRSRTWRDVAAGYLAVFDAAFAENPNG